MKNYHDLLKDVLDNGQVQDNLRTGDRCWAVVGRQLEFDLREGFPALTTRKLPFKNIVGELLGFFRGYDNAADFRALGCGFWDKNANETKAWLNSPARLGQDSLGRIYGRQWIDWKDQRIAQSLQERDRLSALGYRQTMHDPAQSSWLMERGINQLEGALQKLMTDPSDRRIIVSAWRPDEFDQMALAPCHMDYRFVAFSDNTLHVVMTIRSWDLFLGGPANICETAIFLALMARLCGRKAGKVVIQATNAHIYENHLPAVGHLLSREHFNAPQLSISDRVATLSSVDQVSGVFANIEPEDISLLGYECHPPITAEMSA